MTGLFSRHRRRRPGRVGPVILLASVLALQLAPTPAQAAGGTLSVDNLTVHEPAVGSRPVVFTVTLARSDADRVTVDYDTVEGTATAGADFVATRGTLDFGSAGMTRTVRVFVLGDSLDEADEMFALRLTGASTGQTQLDSTATIADADGPPRLSVGNARVTEGTAGLEPGGPADPSGLDATFAVSLSDPSGQPVTVDYATANGAGAGAASGPSDFAVTSGSLTFAPGEQVKPVVVPVTGDTLDEADETFGVALTNAAGATIAVGSGTGTIVDDDGAPALSVEDATGAEGAPKLTFKVSIDRPSSRNVTFRVQTVDGTGPNGATAPGDYTALTSTPAQIPAGETSVDVDVVLTNDRAHEAPETMTLALSSEGNAALARPIATGTITDDDPGPDLSVDDVTAGEGTVVGDSLVFTVRLSTPAGTPVTVDYATADGTAVAAPGAHDQRDYTPAAGTLTFQAAQTTKTVTVFVDHDNLAEGTETVLLKLSNPSAGVPLAQPTGTGTINDDDGPPDELAVKDIGFAEGDTGTAAHLFTVTRTRRSGGPVALPVTVRFATGDGSSAGAGGSAQAGRDYMPRTGVLVFAGSVTTQTISISVTGDLVDEPDETLTVTLSGPTNAVLTQGTGTATIRDDDRLPEISVAPTTIAEGNSGAGSGAAEVVLSSPSSRPVSVDFVVGGAPTGNPPAGGAASAADYRADPPSGTLTFQPGETTRTIGFSVIGDTIDEPDEIFGVALSKPVGGTIGESGTTTGAVTITDDDAPPALSIGDETISETDAGRRPLDFTIVLDSLSGQPVTVTFATPDGSPAGPSTGGPSSSGAVAPADYTAIGARVVSIPPGARSATVAVRVADDTVADVAPSETLAVVLSSPVNATLADGAATATGTIVDDEGPATLAVAGVTVTEGTGSDRKENARFLVTLSKESDQAVKVSYAVGDPPAGSSAGSSTGSATAAKSPDDYSAPGAELTFNPGETVKAVDFPISADSVDEVDESFTVTLSGTDGGTPIDPARTAATATIIDDDGPALAVTDIDVPEGNSGVGNAVFTVTLDAASVQPVTVSYATVNGTAAGGPDYRANSGTLQYAPGETSRTVSVPVVGDSLNEGDEDFLLNFGGETNATVANGAARAVISNDDLSQLDIADAGIAEGDTGTAALAFTVTLTPPSPGTVTVAFASGDPSGDPSGGQSAVAGQDYDAASGQLTFNPGETSKTVSARVIADTSDKIDETFAVSLSAVSAGARLAKAVATGTIFDDDAPPEIFSPDVMTAEKTKQDTSAVFPVRLSGPRSFPVTVRYETLGKTATPGTDFTPVAGALSFAPGDETQPVEVPIHEDSHFEGDETIRLRLSTPGGGVLTDPEAVATILDDDPPAYLMAASDGGIFPFGGAGFIGSAGRARLNSPVVGLAPHPSGRGYWLVGTDGGIFAFGASKFRGSTGGSRLNKPIVGMAPTPSGNGYWLVATDGGIFAFGDAAFHGSTGGSRLNKPIVGMAPTPSGNGYWLVATDGGIFAFGDARYLGSTGATALNKPIVGMAPTPSGDGYWLVATDGGIFAFGDGKFHGSTGALRLNTPIVGMAPVPSGDGYWLVATDGGIFAFGDATFHGSTGALKLNRPVIGMATL